MLDVITGRTGAGISKRQLLKGGLMSAVGLCIPAFIGSAQASARLAVPDAGTFNISFRNVHTNESFDGAYRVGDRYLPEAFQRINVVLRDFRQNEVFPIDPRVMDILCSVRYRTGTSVPFDVLSGYRSPQTNAMLRATSEGVAKNSLHMVGQAIDIHLPGYSLEALRDTGLQLGAGGVGYYPRSNFVHMDTGRVRTWHGPTA
jgi:uncharacterized protein YcbK (DUF882 family)